ncbi:hypothetical protein D3C87_1158640 [compost metagenome]
MLSIDMAGTSVERIAPGRGMKSTAPARTWDSMSVSPPMEALAYTCKSTAPLVSALIASDAAFICLFSGWVSGRLLL